MNAESQARMNAWNARMAEKHAAERAAREAKEAENARLIARRRAARLEREAEEAAKIAQSAPVAEPINRSERPATEPQKSYLRRLGVSITDLTEPNLTFARASALIDAVRGDYLESIGGCYAGTVDAHD